MNPICKKLKFVSGFSRVEIDVSIELDADNCRVLRICGDITGGKYDSAGQCYDNMRELVKAHGAGQYNTDTILKLLEIWERWHLNDMRAGTVKQCEIIRPWLKSQNRCVDYDEQCAYLAQHNLLVDPDHGPNGYRYGTAWLFEPLPAEVIEFVMDL